MRGPTAATVTRAGHAARWVAAGLVALAPLVAAVWVLGRSWTPTSDQALEYLEVLRVGGGDTPLTGAYSRFGWDHPGPVLFWVAAPLTRVFGPTGLAATAGLVNAAAAAGAVLAAWRSGGARLGWLTAAVVALLIHGTGPSTLVDPWNPWLVPLPLLAFLLCTWGAAQGDGPLLLGGVVAGSWALQMHVGTLPVVAAAALLGALGLLLRWRSGGSLPPRTWVVASVAAGLALWSGPLLDQALGSGNLGAIVEWQTEPGRESVPWDEAIGIAGVQFGMPAAWMGASEQRLGFAIERSFLPALTLLVVAAGAGAAAWVRGRRGPALLVAASIALVGISIVGISRITPPAATYLVRWTWPVAALTVLATLWAIAAALGRRGVDVGLTAAALVVTVVLAATSTAGSVGAHPGDRVQSEIAGSLLDQIRDAIDPDASYRLAWIDQRDFGAVSGGVAAGLIAAGITVDLPDDFQHAFGREPVDDRDDPIDDPGDDPDAATILVVARIDAPGWVRPEGAELIAAHDPLSPDERREVDHLEARLRFQLGLASDERLDAGVPTLALEHGVEVDDLTRLRELQRLGDRYTVWLVPPRG